MVCYARPASLLAAIVAVAWVVFAGPASQSLLPFLVPADPLRPGRGGRSCARYERARAQRRAHLATHNVRHHRRASPHRAAAHAQLIGDATLEKVLAVPTVKRVWLGYTKITNRSMAFGYCVARRAASIPPITPVPTDARAPAPAPAGVRPTSVRWAQLPGAGRPSRCACATS